MLKDMPGALRIEGYTPSEILTIADEDLDLFVFTASPVVFRAGSAEVLGQFEVRGDRMIVDLAHIDGGGEGLLPTIAMLVNRVAERRRLAEIEWLVRAVNCASPNPKLRRVLDRRGFAVVTDTSLGELYRLVEPVREAPSGC